METLKELKAIIAGKPEGLATYVDEGGDYLKSDDGDFQIWNSDRGCWESVDIHALPMRSLSDIELIIELMECQENHNGKGKHKTNLLIDAEKLLRGAAQEDYIHLADVIKEALK